MLFGLLSKNYCRYYDVKKVNDSSLK